jgi:hypothetical protein
MTMGATLYYFHLNDQKHNKDTSHGHLGKNNKE